MESFCSEHSFERDLNLHSARFSSLLLISCNIDNLTQYLLHAYYFLDSNNWKFYNYIELTGLFGSISASQSQTKP
jgi:hypothetical protein